MPEEDKGKPDSKPPQNPPPKPPPPKDDPVDITKEGTLRRPPKTTDKRK